jgi:2-keto-4-pentenoate hydratase
MMRASLDVFVGETMSATVDFRSSLWKTYVNHGALVAGPALTDWRILDPVRQPVTLVINGKRVCDTIGGDSAVNPVRLLVWLANIGSRSLGGLHAGQFVTTGSCTGTIFVESAARLSGTRRDDPSYRLIQISAQNSRNTL